jgi:hypothetical protein
MEKRGAFCRRDLSFGFGFRAKRSRLKLIRLKRMQKQIAVDNLL